MAQLKSNPDWAEVIQLAEEYIEDVHDPDITSDELYKYDAAMMEAVLTALFGAEVFDEINPLLDQI